MLLLVRGSFLALVSPGKFWLAPFEGQGKDAKCRTHRWQAGVPCGRVITAGTDADITVVHLGCAQTMRCPSVLQVFILLPSEACQHLQLRFAHLAGLIVSPVVFLCKTYRDDRVTWFQFNGLSTSVTIALPSMEAQMLFTPS